MSCTNNYYTKTQILRFYRKLWEHVTHGDGYQPFGYDWPTLNLTHPHFKTAFQRLREMYREAPE